MLLTFSICLWRGWGLESHGFRKEADRLKKLIKKKNQLIIFLVIFLGVGVGKAVYELICVELIICAEHE